MTPRPSPPRPWSSRLGTGWLFYAPAAVLLLGVVAYPIVRTLWLSLSHDGPQTAFAPVFAGWLNYRRLLVDARFRNALVVTSTFAAVSVLLEFAIGFGLAVAADGLVRGRGLVRACLLAPWTLPTAVLALLWAWIFNDQYGALNAVLLRLHAIDAPVSWLATPAGAMTAIIIADVWKTTPFVFVVLLAGLQNVPRELYDAIAIDGGGAWARIRYVTWPGLRPFIFVALVFRVIQSVAVFDLVYVMTGGGPGGSTETVSVYAYQTYMRYLDIGYGSAEVVAVVAAVLHAMLVGRHARVV